VRGWGRFVAANVPNVRSGHGGGISDGSGVSGGAKLTKLTHAICASSWEESLISREGAKDAKGFVPNSSPRARPGIHLPCRTGKKEGGYRVKPGMTCGWRGGPASGAAGGRLRVLLIDELRTEEILHFNFAVWPEPPPQWREVFLPTLG
jgi:hypothetical protein